MASPCLDFKQHSFGVEYRVDLIVDARAALVAEENWSHDAVLLLLARLDVVAESLEAGAKVGEYAIALQTLDEVRVDGWLRLREHSDQRVYPRGWFLARRVVAPTRVLVHAMTGSSRALATA